MSEYRSIGSEDLLPPPGALITVLLDRDEVVIVNLDGRYHAIAGLCEHAGGPLGAGLLSGCLLTCPLHGWTYDVTDGWLVDPPLGRRVRSYRVRVAAGAVELAPDS